MMPERDTTTDPSADGSEPRVSEDNATLVELWNGGLAKGFLARRETIAEGGRRHSDEALRRHPINPGERVIDLGCGFGDSVVDLAKRVGDEGQVLGVDCSRPLLDAAKAIVATAGLGNVSWLCCDAQIESLGQDYDVCFSRFGSMFFGSPIDAFRNIGRALRDGGRLLLITWQPVDDNEWWRFAREVVANYLPVPPASRSGMPSAFGLSDPDHIRQVLEAAGYRKIGIEPMKIRFPAGPSASIAAETLLESGAPAQALRDAGARGQELRPTILAELEKQLEARRGPNGIELDSASWCVTARIER